MFARLPEAGRTKTRLAPRLGADGAAALYRAFLSDAVATGRRVGGVRLELWVDPSPGALGRLAARYPDLRVRPQAGPDLGARMSDAFRRCFTEGADRVVLVGSDHPTLPPAYLERAFHRLRSAHLVLGPTADGGYYAVGLRRHAWPAAAGLFEGIPWSTRTVLAETRRRADALDLCRVELPAWYDVDEPEDLPRLRRDAPAGSATARALAELAGPSSPRGAG